MKKYKYILFLTLLSTLLSCSDFLDKQPLDNLSSATFWKTPKDADMALAGVYRRLQIEVIAGNMWGGGIGHWDGLTDNAYDPNNWENGFTGIARGEVNSNTGGVINDLYYNCYKGISSCNTFLANVAKIEFTDKGILPRYMAEVRFIRAFFYYWLSQCYGGVPLVTEPLTIDNMSIPRSPLNKILDQIYADLDYAIANLPDEAYSGHVVKSSAQALKARVKLFNGSYAEAATLAKQVIEGKKYKLATDYTSNFIDDSGQESCPEIIFSIKYLGPDNPNQSDLVYGWWHSTIPLPEFVAAHEPGDKRLKWNVIQVGDPWPVGKSVIGNETFPEGRTITNLIVNKWVNPSTSAANWNYLGNDCVQIRYAEVLLVYAEAQNEAEGPSASVYDAINEVRNRSGLPNLAAGLTQAEMREKIRHERRIELAFEGQRYFDLKRWKIAGSIIPTLNDPPNQTVTKRTWSDKLYLWPIPQNEINKDPKVIEQNPGY